MKNIFIVISLLFISGCGGGDRGLSESGDTNSNLSKIISDNASATVAVVTTTK